MITKVQVDRLHKILALGPWNSPTEFIFDAFTKNSNMQSPPPHKFIHLTSPEYDMIMSYGLSKITKTKHVAKKPIEFDSHNLLEPDISEALSECSDDEKIRVKLHNKKKSSIKKNYVSIWDKPLSDIESSLTFQEDEDENDYVPPPRRSSIHRSFFNFTTKKDDFVMFANTPNEAVPVEKSEKILKELLDNYTVQSEYGTEPSQPETQKKTSETLAKFKTKLP